MAGRLNRHAPAWLRRAGLALLVLLVHLWLAGKLADRLHDGSIARAMPPRIAVSWVRVLEPAPPAAQPAPEPVTRPVRRPRPPRVKPVAAAPEPAPVPEPVAEPAVAEPAPLDLPPEAPPQVQAEAPPEAPAAFDWPESTRLSYDVGGEVRGPVHGTAQVEWLRAGTRYQVHVDVTVGLALAPLMTRRMSSEGEVGEAGLRPQRYDEDTRLMFREPRQATVWLDDLQVRLASGELRPRPPEVQDSASQFVQLAWMLARQPELLRTGTLIELPLALPRHVSAWSYEVVGDDVVYTSFGALPVVRLQPRRGGRRGDLSVELWLAPTLRYLPVRLRIRQDEATWIELTIARRPELGEALR